MAILVVFKGHSQAVISGNVKDTQGILSGATVIISKDSTAAILAYGISNSQGDFKIEVNSPADSLFLKISYVGFSTWKKQIVNKNNQFQVQLSPSSEALKEVHVASKIIERRGDTLSFSVAAFKDQKDRVIADVIKKMPGIEIMPGGQIEYQGKPINKYYIEGLDLLEGRYNLANENLSANDVSKVQILENHQPVKVLDSLEFSENAAINIKLKNDITVSGTAEVGAGFSPFLHKLKATPMLFTKKRQAIVTYQSNNTGSDVSREIRDFSFSNFGDQFTIDKTDWLAIQQLSEPPFSQERWLDNEVNLGSVNFLQRLKKDIDLKVNISYLNDTQKQQGSTQTRFFTPNDTINLLENTQNELFTSTLQSKFTLEKNTKENYLKDVVELNGFWDSQRGHIQRPDAEIGQNLNNPFKALRNTFRMLKTVGKQLVTFRSKTGYTQAKQNLRVSPGPFEQILNEGKAYAEIGQFLKASNFFTDNSAGFTKALGKFKISPKIGFSVQNQQLDSDLILEESQQELMGDFRNRLNFLSSEIYFENSLHFKSEDESWNFRLSTPFSFKKFNLKAENFEEKQRLGRLVFEPNLYVEKKVSAFWETSFSAGLKYAFGDIQRLYYGYLLTNYRNLQRYNAPISEKNTQNYSFRLSYRNPLKQLFLKGSYSFSNTKNNLLYSSRIGENGATLLQATLQDNHANSHTFNVNGSKYFRKLHSTLKLKATYSLNKRQQLLNESLTQVKNRNFIANASLDAEVFSWLSATYNASFSVFETAFENAQFQQIKTTQHLLDVFFYLNEEQYFTAGGEYYGNSLSDENRGNYFMNFGYQYSFKKPNIDLNISWNNVLDTDEFVNAYSREFTFVESSYRLRPSQVLASIKFSF